MMVFKTDKCLSLSWARKQKIKSDYTVQLLCQSAVAFIHILEDRFSTWETKLKYWRSSRSSSVKAIFVPTIYHHLN
jgi:hypothetical protein